MYDYDDDNYDYGYLPCWRCGRTRCNGGNDCSGEDYWDRQPYQDQDQDNNNNNDEK